MAIVEIVLIFVVVFAPPLFSYWYVWKLRDRTQRRFMAARNTTSTRAISPISPRRIQTRILGDRTCQFNARSPYLRCAMHPQGPCRDCRDYQPR